MTAITGTLTDNTASPDFTPSESVSEVYLVKKGKGQVSLMAKNGALDPVKVAQIEGSGVIPFSTSSSDITYYLQASGQNIDFDYYVGP